MDIGYLEVPIEPCSLCLWLGDEYDSINVIRARLNKVGRYDQGLWDRMEI